MPLADCNGVSLNYELTLGPPPVLMLSNSLGTDLSMWEPQMPAFSEHFTILRFDTRGHGRSSVPTGPYTIRTIGEDAIALLDFLEIRSSHFCGLSLGGMVGQWLGVHRSERIDRLVLCNSAARIGTNEGWNSRIDAVLAGGMNAVAKGVVERWFTSGFRERAPEVVARIAAVLRANDVVGYAAACAAVRDMDQRDDIQRIRAETLIIAGLQDAVTTIADAELLVDRIPNARMRVVHAAHLSNIEDAGAFTTHVLQFLLQKDA